MNMPNMEIEYSRKHRHDDKKEQIDASLPIYTLYPTIAQPRELLLSLHACQTIDHFYDKVHGFYSRQPNGSAILNDPALHISRIAIYKRHAVVQHEAVVITLGLPGQDPIQDFNILVDRTVTFATIAHGLSTLCPCQKAALDRVEILPVATARPPWTGTRVWTMTAARAASGENRSDRLNLLHLALLLRTVSMHAGTRYDALHENCFWFTSAIRETLGLLAYDNQVLGAFQFTQPRPRCCLFVMGSCLGFPMGWPSPGELRDMYRSFLRGYTDCRDNVS